MNLEIVIADADAGTDPIKSDVTHNNDRQQNNKSNERFEVSSVVTASMQT